MANKLFKSLFAVAMVLGSVLGFVACEEPDSGLVGDPTVEVSTKSLNFTNEEGSQDVDITCNVKWTASVDADWVTVAPAEGNKNGVITVAVSANDTGELRSATVRVSAIHPKYNEEWENKKITVSQSANQNVTVTEELIYSDDFDGKEATKTYGSGSSWPYIDQFPEFANAEGESAANVTYTGSKVSVRANQPSNQSNYSNYAGSGVNNIFFGDGGYFVVNNIAPLSADEKNYKITFGVQKYAGNDGDSSFKYTDFLLYLSKDGEKWAPVEYAIADLVEGKYNFATADFTLAAATDKLYVKFVAKVASVLRIDDLKFFTGNGGKTIDLDNIQTVEPELPEMVEATAAEFLAAAEDSTVYKLTGEITRVVNTSYGNFDITDATGTVYVYGLLTPDGEPQKQFAAAGLKQGDTITVYGTRTSYNGSPQMKNATYISHVAGEGGNGGGNDTPNTPANGIYESDSAFVCTTDDSTNSCYGHKDTKIGNEAVTGFKLGTGSKAGYFKSGAVSVSGDKYLNFYAVAWKGKTATLYMRVDGGATTSFELNAHVGATGNAPYAALTAEAQDHYSVLLEGLTETSTIEFSTDASFSAADNDASGRAIVFGMKLTDEALGEEGGNENPTPEPEPEPEPTPDTMTIAEVLAKGNAAIGGVIEGVVVSNLDLNNLTSKKGMYVQDETGALQFYLAENHTFAFGTKVRIDLTTATLGEYNGAVQISGLALDKIEVISTGNAVEAKTVSMADFLANKYEGQYIALEGVQVVDADLSKTWVMGGSHTSINMEDAAGNKFVVFSSKYATYGTQTVAQGSGVIKGISSISKGAMQIIFAQSSDFAGLTGERFGDEGGEEPTPEPEQPASVKKVTVAEFLAAAEDDTMYELTGEITSVANTTYGNFYLKDSTGEVYIYGLCSPAGEQKYWAASGAKVGDTITVQTIRTSYNGTAQGKNAIFVSLVSAEVDEPETPEGCVEASAVFSELGYANAHSVDGLTISLDENVDIVFKKGGANNAPAYYDSGMAVRMYQNGATLDVTANGKAIKSIELTFANNQYYIGADKGQLSAEGSVRTWTGDATAVKFTSTGTDKDHRAYISAIKVIYAE